VTSAPAPPRAVVIMGVSGSGKSTVGRALAERVGWDFCDADDHHPASNVAKMSAGEPLSDGDREPWLERLVEVMDGYSRRGEPLVLVCSALRSSFRDRLLRGGSAELVFLAGDRDLIAKRMETRQGHFMSHEMIDSQFAALEEPEDALVIDVSQDVHTIVTTIVRELHLDNS